MGNKQRIAMTQKEEVLFYLKRYGSISTIEASNKLYIADLQGLIRDLKKEMDILYIWVHKKNKFGRPCRFKRYYLANTEKNNFFEKLNFLK